MLSKRRVFAAVAAFGVFAAFTGADAHPGLTGLALQQDDTAITKVDYYYSGQYNGGDDYYFRGSYYRGSPFDFPVTVLGGVANLLGGVFSVFDDESCYSRPYYVSAYYGSPYYYSETYRDSSYYNSPYSRGGYYFDSHYNRDRSYYRSHREYEIYNGYDYSYYYNVGYGRYR